MLKDRLLFGRRAGSFTLQWHLTNACESHCAHCYDRTSRAPLDLHAATRVLADFSEFCRRHRVRGHVCLTGGNPFLYPGFAELYRRIASAGYPISILGNPVPEESIAEIAAIQRPVYFQVSLEGLREHNDAIRGEGSFDRTVAFLDLLWNARIRSHVMLTLTRDNIDQVIPLADLLKDRIDRFTFNRLSAVGEGAVLGMPGRREYARFLEQYQAAAHLKPCLSFKDGLFNILRHRRHMPLHRGCTGAGCGAAFNFVALLPDGEVHACRKFPSLIGNVRESSIAAIYDSATARRYRSGCTACGSCPIRRVCGGCLAVTHSTGRDALRDRDPHCFIDDAAMAVVGPAPHFTRN